MKMNPSIGLLLIVLFTSTYSPAQSHFISVSVDTLLSKKISIRAIDVAGDRLYYAGDKSRVGYIAIKSLDKIEMQLTADLEFRSLAVTGLNVFFMNVGSPSQLFRTDLNLSNRTIAYEESHPKAFYDAMKFYTSREGIALGDPTDNCLSILTTKDYGKSWQKMDCATLPVIEIGEAAFAASNTNIVVRKRKTWIVSGGKKSRIFYSYNKGKHWQVFETPIVQGSEMSGIFSADFYNSKIGFIAGGNYDRQNQNFDNKAITKDGGKSWNLVGQNNGPGYISCVQFVPKQRGRSIVTVGAGGLFLSDDYGETWKHLYKSDALFTIRFIDKTTAIAAGQNIIVKLKFNE